MPYQPTGIYTTRDCHSHLGNTHDTPSVHTAPVHQTHEAAIFHLATRTITDKTAYIVEFTTFNGNTLPESEITDAGFGIRDCKKPYSTESSFGIITYDREIVDGMEIAIESSTEHFRLSDQLGILLCRIVIIVTNRRHLLATHV